MAHGGPKARPGEPIQATHAVAGGTEAAEAVGSCVADKDLTPGTLVRQIDTPEFRAWFGASKVVDEQGEPLRVFHGTRGAFLAFDPAFIGRNFKDQAGIFFTNNVSHHVFNQGHGPDVQEDMTSAGAYALNSKGMGGPAILPVYVKLLNPMIIDKDLDGAGILSAIESRRHPAGAFILESVMGGGYDGLIVIDRDIEFKNGQPEILVVALRPDQIKSAIGNSGAFSPADLDITR